METTNHPIRNVRAYGATGNKDANDQKALQAAIDVCEGTGGGTVVVPAGDYLTGTLHLKENVTLQLQAGATLWGSTNRADYDVPHLIYAKDVQNVAIAGRGAIDGQGESFWVREDDRWRPAKWRPGKLIHFEGCRNVLMRDFTVTNAPGWTIHPFKCDNVRICGITILNDVYGPNTDGIDPNCSTNVHISDCHIIAGDDCIVVKATEAYPCENITVMNCTMETTCAALKLGTESHGNIRHLTFANCTIRNTRTGIAFYQKDGGTMEGVTFSNITMETRAGRPGSTEWPIFMDLERRGQDAKVGVIKDVILSNLVIITGGRCVVQGMKTQPIERLTLDNVTFKVVGFEDLSDVPKPRGGRTHWRDPEGGQFVAAPAHLVFSNVKGLRLRDVEVVVEAEGGLQERSAVFGDYLEDVEIRGFRGRQSVPNGTSPVLHLRQCQKVQIATSQAMDGTGTFLRLEGEETEDVSVVGNDFSATKLAVELGDEVGKNALYQAGNRLS